MSNTRVPSPQCTNPKSRQILGRLKEVQRVLTDKLCSGRLCLDLNMVTVIW